MKAKERENLRNHTAAELRVELTQAREKLFRLKFKNGVAPAKNPLELRNLRRHAARLETWIQEKKTAAAAPAPQKS
ncbi:MAG: 50S ribosomal protein L29 [Elusimicrobia bacterium]|nr:50S ribosomal protein L29 [Elusimicrobiota bacterium]